MVRAIVVAPSTVSLRITLRYQSLDEFVRRYADNVSAAGLFLRTKSPKPTGTRIKFELLLSDGSRALRGEGVVSNIRNDEKPGMGIRFKLLDADSQAIIDRIVASHGQGSLAPTPLSPTFQGPAKSRPATTPGWRGQSSSRGWGAKRTSDSGVLPRSASRKFERRTESVPPPRRTPPDAGHMPQAPLPRSRSSAPRPWAKKKPSGRRVDEITDKIRTRDVVPSTGGESTAPSEPPAEQTLRLDVDRVKEVSESLVPKTIPAIGTLGERLPVSDRNAPDPQETELVRPRDPTRADPVVSAPAVRSPFERGESLTPAEIAEAVVDVAASVATTPRAEEEPEPRTALIDRTLPGEVAEEAPSLGVESLSESATAVAAPEALPLIPLVDDLAGSQDLRPGAPMPEAGEATHEMPADLGKPEAAPNPEPSGDVEPDREPPRADSPVPDFGSAFAAAGETLESRSQSIDLGDEDNASDAQSLDAIDQTQRMESEPNFEPVAPVYATPIATTEARAEEPAPSPVIAEPEISAAEASFNALVEETQADQAAREAPEGLDTIDRAQTIEDRRRSTISSEVSAAPIDDADAVLESPAPQHPLIAEDAPVAKPYDEQETLVSVPTGETPMDGADALDAIAQDQPAPPAAEPPAAEPEPAEPETTEPEATEPETTEPEAAEPETFEPQAPAPETTEPDLGEPHALEAEAAPDPQAVAEAEAPMEPAVNPDDFSKDEEPTAAELPPAPEPADAPAPAEPSPEIATQVSEEEGAEAARRELQRVNLEAATEVVTAYDGIAPQPTSAAPMLSTQVSVTGVGEADHEAPRSYEAPPSARPAATARASRRVIEKSAVQRDPAESADVPEKKEQASPAAVAQAAPDPGHGFSEEATLVPPERQAQTPSEELETIAPPESEDEPFRIVGIDFGGRWVRIGLFEHGDLELIPAGSSVYIPALVAIRRDGNLAVGVKARAIWNEDQSRAVSPRALLHALADGKLNQKRPGAQHIASYEGQSAMVQLGGRRIQLSKLLVEFFTYIREAVVARLGTSNFRAVLSVPNDLDPEARLLLKKACHEAKLYIARLESEPNAVLRAYNLEERTSDNILLVDLGANHLCIALSRRGRDGFGIAGFEWDDEVSAGSLDDRIADLTTSEIGNQVGEDHSGDAGVRQLLLEAAERSRLDIRRAPSVDLKVALPAPGGAAGVGVERTIKLARRQIYDATETVVSDIVERASAMCRAAGTDPRAVGAVVLAGSGGSYPPLVQALEALTGQEPLQAIPPTHIFTFGLARGAVDLERRTEASRPDTLDESIGIELPGGRFRPILKAGDKLPATLTRPFPVRDRQKMVEVKLFQGDAEFVKRCTQIGYLQLTGLPKRGADLRMEMRLDAEGVLEVTLTERSTGIADMATLATKQTPEARRAKLPRFDPSAIITADDKRGKNGGFLSRLFGRG